MQNRAERRAYRCINQAGHVDRSNKEWRNRNGNVCWLRDLEEEKSRRGGGRKQGNREIGGERGGRRKVERYDTRGKETYIAACAVRTLAEEFGRRLRSPVKGETKGPVGESNNRAAKLMAPLVPHFSISPAASLPPTLSALSTTLPSAPRRYPPRDVIPLPAETTAGQRLPINNRFIELSSRRSTLLASTSRDVSNLPASLIRSGYFSAVSASLRSRSCGKLNGIRKHFGSDCR